MTGNRSGRLASHRIRLVPGDSDKPSWLAWVERRFLWWGNPRFPVDNERRKSMQRAVDAWRELEQALASVEAHKNDNDDAVKYVSHSQKRAGVSPWFLAPISPKEELVPIPPEFEDVKKRYDRAMSGNDSGGRRGRIFPTEKDSTKSAYIPDTAMNHMPDMRFEGIEHHVMYDAQRSKRQPEQKHKGNQKGGHQQGQPQQREPQGYQWKGDE